MKSTDEKHLQDKLNQALQALDKARAHILSFYQKPVDVEWKADATPVTVADREAEQILREELGRDCPGFGFLGEEYGLEAGDGEWVWVADPVDGTKSFVHGVPLFGTLLALLHQGKPVLGCIDLPALNSRLWASQNQGAWLDGQRVRVSTVDQMKDALVLSGTVNTMEDQGYGESFKKLRQASRLYRGWGDCYGYYLVASGRAEVMVDPVVSVWDVAPLPVILHEAGGDFRLLNGEEFHYTISEQLQSDTLTGCATNGKLTVEVCEYFAKNN